jgi:hypothetical protein
MASDKTLPSGYAVEVVTCVTRDELFRKTVIYGLTLKEATALLVIGRGLTLAFHWYDYKTDVVRDLDLRLCNMLGVSPDEDFLHNLLCESGFVYVWGDKHYIAKCDSIEVLYLPDSITVASVSDEVYELHLKKLGKK